MNIGPRTLLVAKLALSVALVAAVINQVPVADVVSSLATVKPGYVVVCLLITFPTVAISAWRWQMLAQGIISFRSALKYILIGMFYGAILPGTISGDVARGVLLAAKEKSMRRVVLPASILVDRMLGLAALSFLSMLSFALVATDTVAGLAGFKAMALTGVGLSASLIAVSAFSFSPWFEQLVRGALPWVPFASLRAIVARVADAVAPYAAMPWVLARGFALSILVHIFTLVGYLFAFRAFDINVDLMTVTVFFSCLSIILLLPISISGLGVRDVFSVFFFGIMGAGASQAVAISWLLLSLGLVVAMIGAGVQFWELHRPSHFHGRDV